MKQWRGRALIAIALALLACSERAPARADTTVRTERDVDPAERVADTAATLALEGEGLRAFLVPSGSARPIPFGESQPVVLAAVTRLQQGQPPEVALNEECRLTLASWPASGLALWFSADSARRFVGWSLGARASRDSSASALTTASGIGLGSTRAALESTYAARVSRSTLGEEFSAGGMAGLLASALPEAPITHLWAGEVCLAR